MSPLDNLAGADGPLRREPSDAREFAVLAKIGHNKLTDAQRAGLSLESRFDLAYNAAHALCLAALRRLGYRSRNRFIVFQVLPDTLGLGPEVWRVLARCHDARNRSEYTGDEEVDEQMQADLIAACKAVEAALEKVAPRTR